MCHKVLIMLDLLFVYILDGDLSYGLGVVFESHNDSITLQQWPQQLK